MIKQPFPDHLLIHTQKKHLCALSDTSRLRMCPLDRQGHDFMPSPFAITCSLFGLIPSHAGPSQETDGGYITQIDPPCLLSNQL